MSTSLTVRRHCVLKLNRFKQLSKVSVESVFVAHRDDLFSWSSRMCRRVIADARRNQFVQKKGPNSEKEFEEDWKKVCRESQFSINPCIRRVLALGLDVQA